MADNRDVLIAYRNWLGPAIAVLLLTASLRIGGITIADLVAVLSTLLDGGTP